MAARQREAQAKKEARQWVAIQTRAAKQAARAKEKEALRVNRRNQRIASGVGRGALAVGIGATALATATTGKGVRENIALDEQSRRIAINARGPGEDLIDPKALARSFTDTASRTGIASSDVAGSVGAFVGKTGDLKAAQEFQDVFAQVASASGASAEEVGDAAADMFTKFNIKSAEEMGDAFAVLSAQGKAGAFELGDMASHIAKMGASAKNFGVGSGKDAIATLGALAQAAKKSTGSADEAATATDSFFNQMSKKQAELKRLGVKTNDKAGNRRPLDDIIVDLIDKAGKGDTDKGSAKLQSLLDARGSKAIKQFANAYNEAFKATAGTKEQKRAAGRKAAEAEFAKLKEVTSDYSDVLMDAKLAQEGLAASSTSVWEGFKNQLQSNVGPELEKMFSGENAAAVGVALAGLAKVAGAVAFSFNRLLGLLNIVPDEGASGPKTSAEELAELRDKRNQLQLEKAEAVQINRRAKAALDPKDKAGAKRLDDELAATLDPLTKEILALDQEVKTVKAKPKELVKAKDQAIEDVRTAERESDFGKAEVGLAATTFLGPAMGAAALLDPGPMGVDAISGMLNGSAEKQTAAALALEKAAGALDAAAKTTSGVNSAGVADRNN